MHGKILVRSPNWIGDQLMAYSFFKSLRERFPAAWITAACANWVESLQFRSCVNEVLTLEAPLAGRAFGKISALERSSQDARLRGPWDLGISLPNSLSSAWYLYRAGAQVRRGYAGDLRSLLLTEVVPQLSDQHRIQDYFNLLPQISPAPASPGSSAHCPDFNPELEWPSVLPIHPPSQKYWVLAPGAVAPSRRWRLEQFLELAALIVKETGWPGIVIGGSAEKAAGDFLARQLEGSIEDWTGRGSVGSYWQVLRDAEVVVANDSGLAHLASLCARPTGLLHVIWGAGNPIKTLPRSLGVVQASQQSQLECWPCERNVCPMPDYVRNGKSSKNRCLEDTSPQSVWTQLRAGLDRREELRHLDSGLPLRAAVDGRESGRPL